MFHIKMKNQIQFECSYGKIVDFFINDVIAFFNFIR